MFYMKTIIPQNDYNGEQIDHGISTFFKKFAVDKILQRDKKESEKLILVATSGCNLNCKGCWADENMIRGNN